MPSGNSNTGTAYGVVHFPSPWPPTSSIVMWTKREDGAGVDLRALPDGSLIVEIYLANRIYRQDAYQEVRFAGGNMGVLSFVWTENSSRIAINTTHLQLKSGANGEVAEIKLAAPRPPRPSVHFQPVAGIQFTPHEELLVETIKDIDAKLNQPSHYGLLRAAGMLRQLFIDDNPLVHQVNRAYRVPLKFELIPLSDDLPSPPETYWCDISPDNGPPLPTVVCNLDQFLRTACLIYKRQSFTVHDIITCCAHILGGVHAGNPKTDHEKSLVTLQHTLQIGGHSMIDSCLKGIAQVALWGCIPLLDAMFKGDRRSA